MISLFYEVKEIPVHSVLLLKSRRDALNCRKGDLVLGFCRGCGAIFNTAYEPQWQIYASLYEETQGFSETFNAFHRRLASFLIERFDLYDKEIIEIGCGKGEFLTLLCEMGKNRGIGFDPSYVPHRSHPQKSDQITFIKDFFSEKYLHYHADFFVCKMTLEHVERTGSFIGLIRKATAPRPHATVFFQVPDVSRILRELAFWDIYYEHCSYFSAGSLARLFRRGGFDVLDIWSGYHDQYLMLCAKGASEVPSEACHTLSSEETVEALDAMVVEFRDRCPEKQAHWKRRVDSLANLGKRIVVWGGGSKCVSFLTTLAIRDEIDYVVDINPFRQDTYVAGTGQRIVSPHFLGSYRPDVVIVMNPVYRDEIEKGLKGMDLSPEVLPL
jgi:hypothetical protein